MNTTDSLSSKKIFFSENEKTEGYKNYVSINKINIEEKLAYQNDYREYIKNIIFEKMNLKFKEKIEFNFFDYINIFTKSEHSKEQKELLEKIICFKDGKILENEYLNSRDFDLIIDTLKGRDILKALNTHKYNLFHYPGKEINEDLNYCIICKIKTNFFRQIKDINVRKQFKKYKIILKLLSSKPNLENIKNKIGLNGKNELIFMLVTDGDFFQFDYMRYSLFKFKEDYNTDDNTKKYKIPCYLKNIEEISKLNITILLLFVPRTLDDKSKVYKHKHITKMEKEIIELKDEIKRLNEKVDKINETLKMNKKKEDDYINMINKKRNRHDNNK